MDSSVDEERTRGLGLKRGTSERTTTRVGPKVQSEEDNWKYGMANLTKAMARAKIFFEDRTFVLYFNLIFNFVALSER